jgi:hypothetical protein
VLRCIGDRQAGPLGEGFHRALPLGQMLDQLEPVRMPERPGDAANSA